MNSIVVPQTLWPLVSHIDPSERESAGVALARVVDGQVSNSKRLLVRSVLRPSPDDYRGRDKGHATLSPAFVASSVAAAKQSKCAVVFFHTHPFSEHAHFSGIDDDGELWLAEFLHRRIPDLPHATVVIGRNAHSARIIDSQQPCVIDVVGAHVVRWSPNDGTQEPERITCAAEHDRQIRAFGIEAQRRLTELTVAIVGLGGTGSFVAQELAHVGIGNFILLDPDTVETTNLNRVVGSELADAGVSRKVDVADRLIRRINHRASVQTLPGSILLQSYAKKLSCVDAIFCCTDSHGSRFVLNQLAYQYLVPVFDVGVAIVADQGRVSHIFGRAQMLSPGLPCLTCNRTLDPEQIRRDLMSDFERQQDPYILGGMAPQPAVISLNGTMSSLAVTMFLSSFAGVPVSVRHQLYDASRGVVRPITESVVPNCVTCSPEGAFAQGDAWPVPGRTE